MFQNDIHFIYIIAINLTCFVGTFKEFIPNFLKCLECRERATVSSIVRHARCQCLLTHKTISRHRCIKGA